MTTDTQLAPTDADLDDMWSECDMGPEQEVHRRFARAVLARWGQPAIATRITVPTNTMEQEFQNYYRRGFEAGKKANQPTHSGEPVYAFRRKGLDDFCTCTEKRYAELSGKPTLFETRVFYTAQPVEREMLCSTELESYSDAYADTPDEAVAFRDGWRLAEQHYGIKGGQHGADT